MLFLTKTSPFSLLLFVSLLVSFGGCLADCSELIKKWRTLHLLPVAEADAVISSVLDSPEPAIQRELCLNATPERILARLVAFGRSESVPRLLAKSGNSLNESKLKVALWSELVRLPNVEAFLTGLTSLLPDVDDLSLLFPLKNNLLLQMPTEQLSRLLDFFFASALTDDQEDELLDFLLEAVQSGQHLLPQNYFELIAAEVDQSVLFSRFLLEDCSFDQLAVASQFRDRFDPSARVFDASIEYYLPLPVLFTRFYLQDHPRNQTRWSDLFVSSMSSITTRQDLNACFRAHCRLPDAPIATALNYIRFGAYPLSLDPETSAFPALNAVLAGNEELAVALIDNMPIPLGMLNWRERRTGVSILQGALKGKMIRLLRKLISVSGFETVQLKPWQHEQAQQAHLLNIPFEIESVQFEEIVAMAESSVGIEFASGEASGVGIEFASGETTEETEVIFPLMSTTCHVPSSWAFTSATELDPLHRHLLVNYFPDHFEFLFPYRLSLASYSAPEAAGKSVALLTASLLDDPFGLWWLMKKVGVERAWIGLPESGRLAVMERKDEEEAVRIDELYTPRNLCLRYLRFK